MDRRPWHRFYENGVNPSIKYDDLTIPQLLERTAARYGGRFALVFQNESITYNEFKHSVDRLATALAGLGAGNRWPVIGNR